MGCKKGVLKPQCWKHGPCPITRDQNTAFLKHRAQAKYRNEEYLLSFQDYKFYWDACIPFTKETYWSKRGPKGTNMNMRRKDPTKAWSLNNIEFRLRSQIFKRAMAKNVNQ